MIDFASAVAAALRARNPWAGISPRAQAAMSAFAARQSTRPQKAPTAAPKAAPVSSPAPARAATPEQRRVDAFEYPAAWSEQGQQAIAEARAAAPGGAGVDYPASWKV